MSSLCTRLKDQPGSLTFPWHLALVGLNGIVTISNLGRLWSRAKVASNYLKTRSRWWALWLYTFILLTPLVGPVLHIAMYNMSWEYTQWVFPAFELFVAVCLRCFVSLLVLSCGGIGVVQESLEVQVYANETFSVGCISGFTSLWSLFQFRDRATYLLFLQPFLVYISCTDAFSDMMNFEDKETFLGIVLGVEIFFTIVPLNSVVKILGLVEIAGCRLPKRRYKLGVIFFVVIFAQLQWNALMTFIAMAGCQDEADVISGVVLITSVEMLILSIIAWFLFDFSDLDDRHWGLGQGLEMYATADFPKEKPMDLGVDTVW